MSDTKEKTEVRRVLLLASYCGGGTVKCTDAMPCGDCLKMCNVFDIKGVFVASYGHLDYVRDMAKEARRLARAKRRGVAVDV